MKNVFILLFLLSLGLATNVTACDCSSAIEQANDGIVDDVEQFLDEVDDKLDDLSKQLDDNLEEMEYRSDKASSDYDSKLKELLSKFNIKDVSEDSIQGYLLRTKLSPSSSEVIKLSNFLFEYKKLIQLKANKGN
jgi:hypothetical protein